MRIIAICNFKGGVAKTTTAINLAGNLAKKGYKVLIVDLDAQGNASSYLDLKTLNVDDDKVSQFLLGNWENEDEIIQKTSVDNLDMIATTMQNLTRTIRTIDADTVYRSDIVLKKQIKRLTTDYDFVFLDCSPSDNLLNTNALTVADYVLIPIKLDKFSVEGIDLLQEKISVINEESNPNLKIIGVLATMYRKTNLHDAVLNQFRENNFKDLMFNTVIRHTIQIEESQFVNATISDYAINSTAAVDYNNFTNEFLERIDRYEN